MTAQTPPIVQKTNAAIQQLNIGYNAQQDRLLLRVGLGDNSELLLWLTYRVTRQLWQLLNGQTNLPTATSIQAETPPQQAVQQFKQEVQAAEKLSKMDFASPYQPRTEVVNDKALLALTVFILQAEAKLPRLEIPCAEGVTAHMNLTPELMLALCNMLQMTSKEAAWDIAQPTELNQVKIAPPVLVEVDTKKVLH